MLLLSFSKVGGRMFCRYPGNLIYDLGKGQGGGRNDLCDFNVM